MARKIMAKQLMAILKHLDPDFDVNAAMDHIYTNAKGETVYMPPTSPENDDVQDDDVQDDDVDEGVEIEPSSQSSEPSDNAEPAPQQTSGNEPSEPTSQEPTKPSIRSSAKQSSGKLNGKTTDPMKMDEKSVLDWYDKQLSSEVPEVVLDG